jgi:glycosyltransferase involved in cell wall biosynthesis
MKILFLADPSPNLDNWILGIKNVDKEVEITVKSLRFPSTFINKAIRILQWFEWIFLINKMVKDGKYDLVIGYRIPSYGFLASFVKSKPLVIAAQGASDVWPPTGFSSNFKKILHKHAIKKADLVQAWGNEMKNDIIHAYPSEHKILVLPRGIDLSIYNTNKREKNPLIDKQYVYNFITTRSLSIDYNHDKILKGFYEFKKFGIPFRYYIAGTGKLEEKLKKLSSELGLDSEVKFLGRLNLEQLSDYYQKSDVYISIPVTEGVSASLFEAMACGCYPILSNLTAYQQFIQNKKNGTIIKSLTAKNIAWDILDSIGNQNYLIEAALINDDLIHNIADSKKNMQMFLMKYRELCVE